MKIKTLLSAFSLAVSVSLHVNAQIEKLPMKEGIFEPDDSSLKEYGYPEWFRDAKFGIWSHWGPQAVPRQGDWYAKRMYVSNKYNWKEKNILEKPSLLTIIISKITVILPFLAIKISSLYGKLRDGSRMS